jgi:hypothetical protein
VIDGQFLMTADFFNSAIRQIQDNSLPQQFGAGKAFSLAVQVVMSGKFRD